MSTELAQNIAHAGLRAPATSGATSISVELITGAWPTVPFSALMEDGTSRKEQVSVTGVSGNTLTVTRAQGGTSAVAHDTMSSVDVITTLDDLAILETFLGGESVAAHSVDTTAVHGITDTSALALTSALTAHDIDTTSVHGIANTAVLATASSVATAVSNHEADTTAVHGITDTAQVALRNAANTFSGGTQKIDRQEFHILSDGFSYVKFFYQDGSTQLGSVGGTTAGELHLDYNILGASGGVLWREGGSLTVRAKLTQGGDFQVLTAGKGLQVKEGSNAKQGVSTLVGGTVVVSNTSVTASSRIFLTVQSLGTVAAPKAVAVTARTAATSFTITSADATDTSVVAWEIFEPAA